jgi:CheY-like chemotaxis protein
MFALVLRGHDVTVHGGSGEGDPTRKVVLVVEDEALVRLNACDMLGEMGFEVVDAADGVEAMELLETRQDIDLVFSDCRMPRMGGPELARTAAARWPWLKIILTTAYQDMTTPPWPLIP